MKLITLPNSILNKKIEKVEKKIQDKVSTEYMHQVKNCKSLDDLEYLVITLF